MSAPVVPPSLKVASGPADRVPCPHCGQNCDLRPYQEQRVLETKVLVECDRCHRLMEIVGILPVTMIGVRQYAGNANEQATPQQVARARAMAVARQQQAAAQQRKRGGWNPR